MPEADDALVFLSPEDRQAVGWARDVPIQLPLSTVYALHGGKPPTADSVAALRLLRAYTNKAPTSARLPIPYHSIPVWMRTLIAKGIGYSKRRSADHWSAFPRWPIDLSSDCLADLAGLSSPFAAGPTPVILSHDLDSPEGLANLHRDFISIEESVSARSTNYIVPCAWPIDHECLSDVFSRGHEIGIHGYNHANLTPFMNREGRVQRLSAARELIGKYRITGYRAPSLLRTKALIVDLKPLYRYDSSVPTTGGLFPVPNNGCASARPFFLEGIPEIPVSMPRDGSLIFLGYSPQEIFDLWVECAQLIAASGGVVVLLTHCENRFSGSKKMLDVYRKFLAYIAESDSYCWSTPNQVVDRFLDYQQGIR